MNTENKNKENKEENKKENINKEEERLTIKGDSESNKKDRDK